MLGEGSRPGGWYPKGLKASKPPQDAVGARAASSILISQLARRKAVLAGGTGRVAFQGRKGTI